MNIRNFKVSCKTTSLLVFLLTSLAFAYTCNTPATGSGDGGNPPNPCLTDPFGSTCGDDFLQARVNYCITAGNASETRCNTLFTEASASANTCPVNPFSDTCSIANGAFTTYADTARMNRLSFCETTGNETNALCMGANLTNICNFDPFSTICTGYPNILDLQVANCRNSGTDSSCTELLLAKENDLPAYPALPVATTRRGFLEGTATGIDTTGFTVRPNEFGSLNFTATAGTGDDEVSLGGAATDGVAWTETTIASNRFNNYAGIFSGTNMGTVLIRAESETGAMVDWKGIIQSNGILTSTVDPTPFTLNVDLFNRTLKTYIIINSIFAFSIDGTYDAKGLISGTVLRGEYADSADPSSFIATNSGIPNVNNHYGMLTGLIGANGVVAAFHSDITAHGYSGGFLVPIPE